MSLPYIGQQIYIYGGSFFLVIGLIGNGMNILPFSTIRVYRTTPCTFYFLVASIDNTFYMLFNFTTCIFGNIYGIELSNISMAWCKIRQFLLVSSSLITLTCSSLAIIDQFLVTSRNAYLRQQSNLERAHRIVVAAIIFWILHAIPSLCLYDISPITNRCSSTNPIYAIYNRIYLVGLLCSIPITTRVIFGSLTYRNIRQIQVLARNNADRQLTRMTLFQIALVVVCLLLYSIYTAYILITEKMVKDAKQILAKNFILTIVTIITYSYYSVCLCLF